MKRGLDLRAGGAGTLSCLAIAGPAVLAIQILNEAGSADASSPVALATVGAIAISLGVGGYVAAARAPDAPLLNGVAAALAGYAVVQVIALVRLILVDDPVRWVAIPFFTLLAAAIGVGAATVADLRALARRKALDSEARP